MANRSVGTLVVVALLSTSVTLPLAAQTRPVDDRSPQDPTTRPYPGNGGPQVQPVRPGGPQVQPPRPGPVVVQPSRPRPEIQPPRPTYPGGPSIQPPRPGDGYSQMIRCESRQNRRQRCAVNTDNRVQLMRTIGGNCVQGRSWGYDQRSIWVDRGCRADFSYGRWAGNGGNQPDRDRDKGPSTGVVIAGVAVAAGLIALLASSANKKKAQTEAAPAPAAQTPPTYPAGPPAALVANLSPLPSASRASVQTCLNEAARQIGATGGTRLSYDRLVSLEPGNGGWRFGASLTARYPDGDRELPLYCRATPTNVIQLDFANAG